MRRYKWMLPVKQSNLTNVDWIHPKAKYHCFFKNTSLCEKYWQDQDFFTTDIDTEEIEKNPGLACKKCYQLWKNLKLAFEPMGTISVNSPKWSEISFSLFKIWRRYYG